MVRDERARQSSESAAIVAVSRKLGIRNPEALRKWLIQADYDDSANASASSWRTLARKSLLRSHTIFIGVAVVILGALGVSYSQNWLGLDRSQPDLQVDQVALVSAAVASSSDGSRTITPFTIDIKLLNPGTQLVAINSARLVIQRFAVIPQCASQGGFASTGSYPANMPASPRPGSAVSIRISQLVEAGGADRFDLRLQAPIKNGDALGQVYLYRIDVSLQYDSDDRSIDVGEVLVTLPLQLTDGNGYFWSHELASQQSALLSQYGPGSSAVKRCLIANSHTINSILSLPAKRTAGVAALRSELAY